MSRPAALSVSMASVSDRNATPRFCKSVSTATKCDSDRPSRSSFHTTSTSPARREARQRVSSGRLLAAPLAVSVKTWRQPAAFKAAICKSAFWSSVETRA